MSLQFGGVLPEARTFEESAAVILPVPFDRTTSYVPGTRNGPRELLLASAQVELWDEELAADVHNRGMVTLRNETRNQNGDVVQVQVAKLIVPRRVSHDPTQ